MDAFTRERIRHLARMGWTTKEIAREMRTSWIAVNRILRASGLLAAMPEVCPAIGYSLLPVDDGELTPLRREERAAAVRRAYEVALDHSLTESEARKVLSMGTRQLAERDGVTVELARVKQGKAWEFVCRLARAEQEEPLTRRNKDGKALKAVRGREE